MGTCAREVFIQFAIKTGTKATLLTNPQDPPPEMLQSREHHRPKCKYCHTLLSLLESPSKSCTIPRLLVGERACPLPHQVLPLPLVGHVVSLFDRVVLLVVSDLNCFQVAAVIVEVLCTPVVVMLASSSSIKDVTLLTLKPLSLMVSLIMFSAVVTGLSCFFMYGAALAFCDVGFLMTVG